MEFKLRDLLLFLKFACYFSIVLVIAFLLGCIAAYTADVHRIRSNSIKGPLLAGITDIWLIWVTARGHRSEIVHKLHKAYGTFVRLAPNHVSVGDPKAVQEIYGYSSSALKSDFYDAFVSTHRGIFSTRSHKEHARKRKMVSGVFSLKSVREFEPFIRCHVHSLIRQWDKLYLEGSSGTYSEVGRKDRQRRAWLDCLSWYNFLAFDIAGELALGFPFGMVKAGNDSSRISLPSGEYVEVGVDRHVTAVQVFGEREEFSTIMGCVPQSWRPFAQFIFQSGGGSRASKDLIALAEATVSKQLSQQSDRSDVLSKLREAKDDNGIAMEGKEITAEIITQLVAGSESTSSTCCAITFYLAQNPAAQAKLHKEFDDNLTSCEDVVPFDQAKSLPYLEAVINETFRVHSTLALGLPREAPASGLTVCGKTFPQGTILSAPSYTIHRCEAIWGEDVESFRPERWLEQDSREMQKAFVPYSIGPRTCIGRNLANMELFVIISSIFRRYEFILEESETQLEIREGFLRKPLSCRVGLRRRTAI